MIVVVVVVVIVVVVLFIVVIYVVVVLVVAAVFLFDFWVAFAKLHVLVNSTQRKLTNLVNQHLKLLLTDILTFPLKTCYTFFIPLMEKYNFILLHF
jgi:hypothetical protein